MILKATVEIDYSEENEEVRGVELVLPCGDHKKVALDLGRFRDPYGDDVADVLNDDNEYSDALQSVFEKYKEELMIESKLTNREMDK